MSKVTHLLMPKLKSWIRDAIRGVCGIVAMQIVPKVEQLKSTVYVG